MELTPRETITRPSTVSKPPTVASRRSLQRTAGSPPVRKHWRCPSPAGARKSGCKRGHAGRRMRFVRGLGGAEDMRMWFDWSCTSTCARHLRRKSVAYIINPNPEPLLRAHCTGAQNGCFKLRT